MARTVPKLLSAELNGLDAELVEVEADINVGLHAFNIIGLGDKAVSEAKERVNSALKNSDITLNIGNKHENKNNAGKFCVVSFLSVLIRQNPCPARAPARFGLRLPASARHWQAGSESGRSQWQAGVLIRVVRFNALNEQRKDSALHRLQSADGIR